jgi:hypothetical protein
MFDRSMLEERDIEYDGLAVVLFICSFVGIAALTAWMIGSAAQTFSPLVFVAGALVAAAVNGAWIFGYPRRAAIPAMSLVMLLSLLLVPAFFDVDGLLLREAEGAPSSVIHVAVGLYVGGLGIAFLAFMVFGFLGPLIGAVQGLLRGEKRARETLVIHCVLTFAALVLVFFPRASP